MSDYLSNIHLIDIASYIFVIGGLLVIINISRRTGESFLGILFGINRIKLISEISRMEKIAIILLFVILFVFGYLGTHNIETIGDGVGVLLGR